MTGLKRFINGYLLSIPLRDSRFLITHESVTGYNKTPIVYRLKMTASMFQIGILRSTLPNLILG